MKTAKTVYAVGFLKSLVMISRRHGVFLYLQHRMASQCRCRFESFFVRIKHRGELPLFFCTSRFQGFADGVSVCAEASDQSAAFFKKLRTLCK